MAPLSDTDIISRFLHLGTDQPYYIRKTQPLDINEGCRILAPIQSIIDTGENNDKEARKVAEAVDLKETPLETVIKALKSGCLIRNDECLFTLAYLARKLKDADQRKVYEALPNLIASSKDLFLFVNFYQSQALKAQAGKGFGNGMRVAIRKWYDKHTAEELAQLLATDAGSKGWCHRDLLLMTHIKVDDEDKMQVIDAAAGGMGRKRPAKVKETQLITEQMEAMMNDAKSKNDQQSLEASAPKKSRMEPSNVDSDALKTFKRIKAFKTVDKVAEASYAIRTHKYPLRLVPTQLLRASNVWENLFPNMEYRDIVNSALVLHDYKLIKENDSQLSNAYGKYLNCMTAVSKSKIHPIYIYQTMRLFEERQRYLNVVKEAVHTANNLALRKIEPNAHILKGFYAALNQAMRSHSRTGLNFLITLDLRSKQSKKRVFGNRLMSCQAAYVLLTLPVYKHEPHVQVLSFAEDAAKLNDVQFTREMDFLQGCEHIQHKAMKKTVVNINQPILYAQQNNKKIDVFITIVDSLIRVNPKRISPIETLNKYNAAQKRNACYILVNLCRHQQDLIHTSMAATKGVLELAGCTEDTPKVIEAYVKKHFT